MSIDYSSLHLNSNYIFMHTVNAFAAHVNLGGDWVYKHTLCNGFLFFTWDKQFDLQRHQHRLCVDAFLMSVPLSSI